MLAGGLLLRSACVAIGRMRGLRSLSLAATSVTDDDLAPLATLGGLRELELNQTAIGEGGLATLSRLAELETIDLRRSRVGEDSIGVLRRFPRLRAARPFTLPPPTPDRETVHGLRRY